MLAAGARWFLWSEVVSPEVRWWICRSSLTSSMGGGGFWSKTARGRLRATTTCALIRLKSIYNFLCFMLVYTPFALCFVTLRGVFMHFPELTY
jgi:hypothetical protein